MTATGKILSVAHTGITVSDLARAIVFFRDGLGAEVSDVMELRGPVFERLTGVAEAQIDIAYVDLAGHKIELLQYRQPASEPVSTARPCNPGHFHLALNVEGVDGVIDRMREHGFSPLSPVQNITEGPVLKVIYTLGFDGIIIELMDSS